MTITCYHDIARRRELHRLKANNVSFQSVQFPSSGDIMVKSYGHLLVGMYFKNFRKNFGLILRGSFWGALCVQAPDENTPPYVVRKMKVIYEIVFGVR